MDTETYSNEEVAKYLNERFVNIRIDIDNDKATATKFQVRAIPDTVFLDSKGEKQLLRILGHRKEFFQQVKALEEISSVEKSLLEKPDDVATLVNASEVYSKLGRLDDAQKVLEKALTTDDQDKSGLRVEIYYKLGIAHSKAGDDEKAEAAWMEAGRLDPDNRKGFIDDIQFARCEKLSSDEDYGGAGAGLTSFLERFPESDRVPDAKFLLGVSQFFTEKKDEAVETWKKLIQDHPGTPAAEKAEKSLKFAEKKGRK